MGGANFKQKNLLKDLIYLGQTKPINKQTINGLFRFALEPILEAQSQKAVVLVRLSEIGNLEGVLKRLEYTSAEVYSFDDCTRGENLCCENIWGDTEFLVILSPRYSVVLLWDYSTETVSNTSCAYYLLNSKNVNNVIKIISDNSKINLMRYTQEYTPERRTNDIMNKSIHKFIDFADSFVEEVSLTKAEVNVLDVNDEVEKKYEYITKKTKVISHDIKNHLSVIDLYSKILEKRVETVSCVEIKDSIENAVSSIKKSKDAISQLLGELKTIQNVDLQTLNFANFFETAISLVKARVEDENIALSLDNNYFNEILADESKLLNVFINVVYNAVDALKDNDDKKIQIRTELTDDNMLKILISNNGTEISNEMNEKIFEDGYTSKVAGSGLGLFVSRQAMQQQYGDLKLVDSNSESTTFEISVPRL